MKILYFILYITCVATENNGEDFRGIKEYVIGFSVKRKEQFKSVEQWARNSNNYELIRLAFDAIIKVKFTEISNFLQQKRRF